MTQTKQFKELTEKGQKQRLAKYAKQREENGTVDALVRLVKPAVISETKTGDGSKTARFRFAEYNKETGKTDYYNASAFIKPGQDKLEAYYADLAKGDLVSIEYKMSADGQYRNLWNVMDRRQQDADNKAKRKAEKEASSAQASAQAEPALDMA